MPDERPGWPLVQQQGQLANNIAAVVNRRCGGHRSKVYRLRQPGGLMPKERTVRLKPASYKPSWREADSSCR